MKNAARTEAVIRKIVKINSELKDANQIKDNYVSLYMKLSTQCNIDLKEKHPIADADRLARARNL